MTDLEQLFTTMEYGPAPEEKSTAAAWLASHQNAFGHFINGQWSDPRADFSTTNPATGEQLATLSQGSKEEIDSAVSAARKGGEQWRALSGHQRGRHLYALARHIQKFSRILAIIETMDNGKPIRESRDIDIPLVARHFYHHAGWAPLIESELPHSTPHGVVGQVIPWNFPLLMLAWKVAPALAAGNSVVLKPAEYTSLSALLFAEIAHRAGLPPGTLNIVTGDGATGRHLVNHSEISKVAFTGSTAVGREIRKSIAGSGKALTLELGGKSPFIVFADADIDSAVEGVVDAIWFNQGQVCCAGSRLLLQEGIAEPFIDRLKERMSHIRVGDPLDKAIDMGAIVDPVQRQQIADYVETGKAEGASCWQAECPLPESGCFYPPTLFTGVEPAHTIAQEEIFGPVLATLTFRTHDEAVALANNSRYGLAASVWSENINMALDVASRLEAGVVWVNATNLFDAGCGFGGYHESGYGREGGIEGLWAYRRSHADLPADLATTVEERPEKPPLDSLPSERLDRTAKLYIGGVQTRPDGGHVRRLVDSGGQPLGEVGEGNRKDIRNAVEAARNGTKWSLMSPHQRAQVLYFLAENLEVRTDEFAKRLEGQGSAAAGEGAIEVHAAIDRLFTQAAWCDKFEGPIHHSTAGRIVFALPEPIGVMAILCPDRNPLLSMLSLLGPALAMGNRVVLIPSERYPLVATDLYQVFETSDLPAGSVNVITGSQPTLNRVLSSHDDVDAIWCVGNRSLAKECEQLSVGNLKQTWTTAGERDWFDPELGSGREFLRRATQVKNLWIPFGE
ncbi:MAG: aldehyde dehydrogenase family protein [Candidatus Thalassarchaeaceae archaeon]|jgi:aldehyde dehydrogenase (NAD+)|nr:aldehyde dehydrogenase family protein [Candidatus Thalassarchaeaceae archaeon]